MKGISRLIAISTIGYCIFSSSQKVEKFTYIFFMALFIAFITDHLSAKTASAASAKLSWNTSSLSDLQGYKVYYGSTSGGQYLGVGLAEGPSPVVLTSANTNTTISGLQEGSTYYFAVSAYSATTESDYSNEIKISVNNPADLSVSNLTSSAATITWTTGTAATSEIRYGTTTSYGSGLRHKYG